MPAVRSLRTVAYLPFAVVVALMSQTAAGQQDRRTETDAIAGETQFAIDRALAWLAGQQVRDGSFGLGSGYGRNVAVTSLGGMAFLSAGHTPGRGRYGPNVERVTDFLLAAARPNGYINVAESQSHGPMYGHGFATLYLAEVYGMSRRDEVRNALSRAVRLIVNSQNEQGGWRYFPEPTEADISVTVCQIMALRAARNAGIEVPKETVDRCVDFVKQCQNPDGGFRYQLERQAESLFPRSAAALVALYSAGIYEGETIDRGIDYVARYVPRGEVFRHDIHYFYGQYYAVQAMWQAGGERWERWYPAIRDELLDRQLPNGSWADTSICNEYGTAMACIILQVPNNYLPIFER